MSEGGTEAIRADDEVVAPPRYAAWKSGFASLSGCWAERPWRSRSSRRRSTSHGQKNRSCYRTRRFREVPGDDGQLASIGSLPALTFLEARGAIEQSNE
jgi:hypothetical protein